MTMPITQLKGLAKKPRTKKTRKLQNTPSYKKQYIPTEMRVISPPVPTAPVRCLPAVEKLLTLDRNFGWKTLEKMKAFAQKYEQTF